MERGEGEGLGVLGRGYPYGSGSRGLCPHGTLLRTRDRVKVTKLLLDHSVGGDSPREKSSRFP